MDEKLFEVFDIPADAAESLEPMGTKRKFWFDHETFAHCLYKVARPETGEDWAEKIVAELCELLGLPHARYELASWRDTRGTVSPTFVPDGARLIHGNELLFSFVSDYPAPDTTDKQFYRISQHTVEAVFNVLDAPSVLPPFDWSLPDGVETAWGVFVGYLMLDVWTANQDRHHENWALMASDRICLAPTYDHASSLGRNETDQKRSFKLTTRDPNQSMEAYVQKATSALYATADAARPLSTLDAFWDAARRDPRAGNIWLDRLARIRPADTLVLFRCIPTDRISQPGIQFAQRMLELNQHRLLGLRGELS